MTKRILVVDDEESLRFTFHAFLSDAGYRVDTAATLAEAVEQLDAHGYDVIFLDILLGRDNGMQFLQQAQARCPNCPVIMVTGAPDLATASAALRFGAFDYVAKPVHQDRLLRLAQLAIERKVLLDEQETFRLRMAAVFQSIQEGILIFDDELRIVDANASACRLLAYDKAVVGRTLLELAEGRYCRVARQFHDIVAQRCSGEIFRLELVNRVGQPLLVSLTSAPLTGQAGRETGVVLVLREEGRAVNVSTASL